MGAPTELELEKRRRRILQLMAQLESLLYETETKLRGIRDARDTDLQAFLWAKEQKS